MPLKNTPDQFGSVTKAFHWIIALLVIGMLVIGHYMDDMPGGIAKLQVYNLHKSFGVTILILTLCRIAWNFISERPHLNDAMPRWEVPLARPLQNLFYILLIAMPLTGWIFSSAAERPVEVFGLFTLPNIAPPDKALSKLFKQIHGIIGYALIVAAVLHIGSVLKHHFLDKDEHLKRMLPKFAFLLAFLCALPATAADVPAWHRILEKSSITFKGKQMGEDFKGSFELFATTIAFDPDNLAASKAVVEIMITSARTGAGDRDDTMRSKEWFDVTRFPSALFETKTFRKTGDNTYEADGTLTIRDITLPVTLPFKLDIVKDDSGKETATMDGSITLDRSKFQLGTGSWADTSVVANAVQVDIHLVAIHMDAKNF